MSLGDLKSSVISDPIAVGIDPGVDIWDTSGTWDTPGNNTH